MQPRRPAPARHRAVVGGRDQTAGGVAPAGNVAPPPPGAYQVFVPSIYGEREYATIYYGGQWVTIVPPPLKYPGPALWPAQSGPPAPPQIPAGYGVVPFTAQGLDYQTILLRWKRPTSSKLLLDFRLLRNRSGFPVDENDGEILMDMQSGYPSDYYLDGAVIPGTMHYYGIYLLLNLSSGQVWYRAGLTATLATTYLNTAGFLSDRLPQYFTNALDGDELTSSDFLGNSYLSQFISVLGWGGDYLRTQLSVVADMLNPETIPVNYLAALAATVGFPFYPEITAGVTRNALKNNAYLIKQRGTLQGIEAMITQLTSWGADVRVGYNLMLEDDQADFLDPVYPEWNPAISYDAGEYVTYLGYTYVSQRNINYNTPPTGNLNGNQFWEPVYYNTDTTVLANPATGGLSTWEGLVDNYMNGVGPQGSLVEYKGIYDPVTLDYNGNGLGIFNLSEVTGIVELRSISRLPGDVTYAPGYPPDPSQVIGDGIPVPFLMPQMEWDTTLMYAPDTIVSYQGLPFQALRASQGVPPPSNGIATDEWQPIGYDSRIALMLSGYTSQPFTALFADNYEVVPYVQWFDENGKYISTVLLRTNLGANGAPESILYHSFALPAQWGADLTATTPDIAGSDLGGWTAQSSSFLVSAFSGGTAIQSVTGVQTLATVSYPTADVSAGVTLSAVPGAGGTPCGLALRVSGASSYIRVDQLGITVVDAGVATGVAVHEFAAQAGDRLSAVCSGSTVTAYINGLQVSTATITFNQSATDFGIIIDLNSTGTAAFGSPMPACLAVRSARARTRAVTGSTR